MVLLRTSEITSKFQSAFGDFKAKKLNPKKTKKLAESFRSRRKVTSFFEKQYSLEVSKSSIIFPPPELSEEPVAQLAEERDPKMYVDVNVSRYGMQRIIVYEGDKVEKLVQDF